MIEPRTGNLWLQIHPHMKYLGGTADFDLWYRDDKSADPPPPNGDILAYLRVVRVKAPYPSPLWDDFRLPLRLNVELNSSMEPAARRIKGRWNDIHLTRAELDEITLYLRCFAPWVLEEELTDDQ
jgi:hypothetical protein